MDGEHALGQVGGEFAMRVAIAKARATGGSYVGVKHGNHFGALGYYPWLAAREGLIGITVGNDIPSVAAPGSRLAVTGTNPLAGEPPPAWGARFPDMLDAYDPGLRALARRHARDLGFDLPDGIYAGLNGPSYETPAEVRMLRALGADLVGMSTVHEVIAARHLALRCLVLSLVANPGAGVTDAPLNHEEVLEAGQAAATRVRALIEALLADPQLR